jgi:hypothetical protein
MFYPGETIMRSNLWFIAFLTLTVALLSTSEPALKLSASTGADTINLPNGWLPEGVVVGGGHVIYAGSRRHGAIYAADLRTGQGFVAVPPQQGRIAVGLAFDSRTNYIFVAGGPAGAAYVYDASTGESVQAYQLAGPGPTFVNDAVVTRDAAYLTDSLQPVIYRIPLGPGGRLPEPNAVATVPVSGDYQHLPGFNANGIEATPAGDRLILVQSNTGLLFVVDPDTGVAATIDLGGYSVTAGDGILLDGQTLYVVRNQLNLVAEIKLAPALTSGELVKELTNPNLDIPTTLDRFGDGLYVVNARFTSGTSPDLTYTIVRLER